MLKLIHDRHSWYEILARSYACASNLIVNKQHYSKIDIFDFKNLAHSDKKNPSFRNYVQNKGNDAYDANDACNDAYAVVSVMKR